MAYACLVGVEWLSFLFEVIKPSIPDFTWGVLTSEPGWGDVDRDGWCVCSIQVSIWLPNGCQALPAISASRLHGAHTAWRPGRGQLIKVLQ